MRTFILAALVLACGEGENLGAFAHVSIDAPAELHEAIRQVHVVLGNSGDSYDADIPEVASGDPLSWPRQVNVPLTSSRSGTLTAQATAVDGDGATTATASAEAEIVPGGRTDLAIMLVAYQGGGADAMTDGPPAQAFGQPCAGGEFGPCAAGLTCVRQYPGAPYGVCGSDEGCMQARASDGQGDSCVAKNDNTRCAKFDDEPAVCLPACTPPLQDDCAQGLACDFANVRWTDGISPVCAMPRCESDDECNWLGIELGAAVRCQFETTAGMPPRSVPMNLCVTTGTATGTIGGPCVDGMKRPAPDLCPPSSQCIVSDAYPGGYCVRYGCAYAAVQSAFACGDGEGCYHMGRGRACQDLCTVGADCRTDQGYVCCRIQGSNPARLCTAAANCSAMCPVSPAECPAGEECVADRCRALAE